MIDFNLETTNAIVIGDHYKTGQLYYESRPQGPQILGDSDKEVIELARIAKKKMINACGTVAHLIYSKNTWELRIRD